MNTLIVSALTHEEQSENIKGKKNRIFDFFKRNQGQAFSSNDIDMKLNIENSYKRISELLREGLIMPVGMVKDSGKWSNRYIYSSPEHRDILIKKMFEQDFKSWVKQGERFKELMENETNR